MDEERSTPTGLPSRRTVIGAAAWSVPVIALATATPAFAASSPPTLSFTKFSPAQKPAQVVVTWAAKVSGAPSVSASLLVQVYKADGTLLASKSATASLKPTGSGKVTLTVPRILRAHHVTATLTASGLKSVSTTANL